MPPAQARAGQSPLRISYEEVLRRIAEQERAFAARLPYHLGITTNPDGGWEDYTRLELLYDMPLLVARDLCSAPSQQRVARFRFAHHCVGFCGLIKDRTADRQVRWDVELASCYQAIEQVTQAAVREALGDQGGDAIRAATRAWVHGVRAEKRALRRRVLVPAAYAHLIHQKTSWLLCTTLEMLAVHGAEARVADVRHVMQMVILGLQARDDALDAVEDEDLHGCSFPKALGVDPFTLGMFGQTLLGSAVLVARERGFPQLATWLETNQTPGLIDRLPGERLLGSFGAFTLAHGL